MQNGPFSHRLRRTARRLVAGGLVVMLGLLGAVTAAAKACVWKVTDADGHTLYLAGSVHVLRATDFPLPPEYADAFNASYGVSFEFKTDEHEADDRWSQALDRACRLPDGVTLKDRVDPRTYAYLRKIVVKFHGSPDLMQRLDHLKAWYIGYRMDSPKGLTGASRRYGVESYLVGRAHKEHKKLDGLVTLDEHIAVLSDMSDADSEAALLLAFIHLDTESARFNATVSAWKQGDIAAIEREMAYEYGDAPGLRRRMLSDRNQRWLPKLETYLHSGRTWMVVAGAGHMAGENGVPALLRARGYQVEQL